MAVVEQIVSIGEDEDIRESEGIAEATGPPIEGPTQPVDDDEIPPGNVQQLSSFC